MQNREQELNQALEAMHFGFRAMTYKPDQRLAELGLARIHHRLLYFVARHPDCSINELLQVMQVSKQYLHQPLKKMLALGYIQQHTDERDRRIKRLLLSASGKRLEYELSETQRQRFADIFASTGPEVEKHWRQVMELLADRIDF